MLHAIEESEGTSATTFILASSVIIISLNVCVIDRCFYFQVQRPLHQSSLRFIQYLLFLPSWKTCQYKLQITPLHRLYSVRAVDLPLLVKSKLVCVVFSSIFNQPMGIHVRLSCLWNVVVQWAAVMSHR